MNDREVLNRLWRDSDTRDSLHRRRQRREEREWKMAHGTSKLRTIGPVPGIDGIERFELRNVGAIHDSDQIQTSVGNRACTVGEADQREHRARRPDFGVIGASGFEGGKREDDVADRTRADQKTAFNFRYCPQNGACALCGLPADTDGKSELDGFGRKAHAIVARLVA